MLADERGSQNAKSAVGILFFFLFVGGGALVNSSSLPLSYNIAFGDTGNNSGSGGTGGGGGGGGGGFSYNPRTRARIDFVRLTVHYDGGKKETKSLGSVSNDVSAGGTGWLYPENTGIQDGNRAQAEMQFGETSYYLRPNNFGFAVPKSARMTGVTLEVKRSAEGPDAIRDYSVRLFAGGKPAGAERAADDAWPAQDEFKSYGGANDLWGVALSPDDVSNASFGALIAARNGGTILGSVTQAAAPALPSTAVPAAPVSAGVTDIESLARLAEKEKRGANVVLLQDALIRAGRGPAANELARAGSTGYYGPVTQRALAEWRGMDTAAAPVTPAAAPVAPIQAPAPKARAGTAAKATPEDAEVARSIRTPLVRDDKGDSVATLQKLLVKLDAGPEARALAETGPTGVYGPRTERAVAELQEAMVQALKGPEAWKLAQAFFKFAKGSWGDATRSAAIEYLGNLR